MTYRHRFIKRTFDIFLASFTLLIFFPIIILASLCIKLGEGGDIFFIQERVGKDGKLFNIYKFRTMRQKQDSTSTVTVSGDARVTTIGSFLRRWKLDELPQLWNVVTGDMSFVGPRPDVPGYADCLSGDDRILLAIRPGITGPATLKYRNEEELLAQQDDPETFNREVVFPDKVKINKEYIKNYGFFKDLKYILMTIVK
ncbi:MAG: Undecaprenyl phosphate N,N'-diacetylbacillosamine 1-phosphate transferase [Syntrophus sp. PtaB.Bin001]|nr:MAG: Undecaprenyl phosphate N,N'-diacetylbacillosamine 1-phosphate transferase [Syntrophus sp. PtaB.Bin001]